MTLWLFGEKDGRLAESSLGIRGLERIPSYIIWEGLTANDECPYMRQRQERHTQKRRVLGRWRQTGLMLLKAQDGVEPPEAGRGREGSPWEPSEGGRPC